MSRKYTIWENAGFFCIAGFLISITFSKALSQMFLGLGLLAAIVIFIQDGKYRRSFSRDSVFWIILMYVVWSFVSSFFGTDARQSLAYLLEDWLFIGIPVIAVMITSERRLFILLETFLLSASLMSLYGIAQHFIGVDWYISTSLVSAPSAGFRAQGFFPNVMTYGNFFAISTLFLLGCALHMETVKRRFFYYGGFILAALAALLSYGRGPMGAIVIGLLTCLFFIPRRFLKHAAIFPVIFAALVYWAAPDILFRHVNELQTELKGEYIGSRQAIWRTAGRMIADHPLFGVGRGNFKPNSEIYRDEGGTRHYTHAHNDWLNVAASGGIPALILFIGMWLAILVKMKTSIGRLREHRPLRGVMIGCFLASIVFVVASFYEATFDDTEVRLLLTGIWGVFYGMTELVKKNTETADYREMA